MPGEFVFVPTHYSPELQSELAKALRARTEIVSRKKNPKLWRMTDGVNRFAEECRADDPLLKRRGIVRTVLSVILAATGVFLLVTGLMEPKNMTLLVTGVIALVIAAARFLPRPDADMTRQGIREFGTKDLDFVVLENVGNLVCPAEFDTGSTKNAMILSVPEGDDKPLKYPLMFSICDVVLINKCDTLSVFDDFSKEAVKERILKLNPDAKIFFVSAKTGEGFDEWADWIRTEISEYQK